MIKCKLCSGDDTVVVYNGLLRVGSYGKNTENNYQVYKCKDCNCGFINNILPNDYYQSTNYRNDYNDSTNIADFYKEYDVADTNKISKIGLNVLRDKVIADFGTAAGTFLQALTNISRFTIAIEPSLHFHQSLNMHSKHVFSYGKELVESGIKIDIATSFDVIEHVDDPELYLKEIYKSMNQEAKLYLKTPNFQDILHKLIPEHYDSFNYRTAHLFYFDNKSIRYLLKKVGFSSYFVGFTHDYDFSNLLYWMKENRPTGLGKTKMFDKNFNQVYKNYLEQNEISSHLWIEAIK